MSQKDTKEFAKNSTKAAAVAAAVAVAEKAYAGGGPSPSGSDPDMGACQCMPMSAPSSPSSGDGGPSPSGGESTPFIFAWDGVKYVMDNDVMFGKPTSRYKTLAEARKAYEAGVIKSDQYILQTTAKQTDGVLKFQIKEIEPEVSLIDSVMLKSFACRENVKGYVGFDYSGPQFFDQQKMQAVTESATMKATTAEGEDVSTALAHKDIAENNGKSHEMNEGDVLNVRLTLPQADTQYVVFETWYRDWVLGDIYREAGLELPGADTKSPYQSTLRRVTAGVLGSVLGFLGVGYVQNTISNSDMAKNLSDSFAIPRALGEHLKSGKCLHIAYRHPETGVLCDIDFIEPRYKQPSSNVLVVPASAQAADGTVELVVSASKRHRISGIAVATGAEVAAPEAKEVTLTKAVLDRDNVDYVATLTTKQNKQYLETLPGDTIDLEFDAGDIDLVNSMMLVSVSGAYAPATKEDQQKAGDWVKKLDKESIRFLADVYRDSYRKVL